jgi:hypothetical protein
MESSKYWAFISYCHLDNRRERRSRSGARLPLWGNWLHETLETYKVPKEIAGHTNKFGETIPARIFPIFQDEKELQTGPDLADTVREALNLSRFLVVVCSPRSSRSLYCNEEVRYWKELGRQDRILPIIIDGEPNALDGTKAGVDPAMECFMPALRHPLDETNAVDVTRRDVEPLCADVRSPEHGGELTAAKWRRAAPSSNARGSSSSPDCWEFHSTTSPSEIGRAGGARVGRSSVGRPWPSPSRARYSLSANGSSAKRRPASLARISSWRPNPWWKVANPPRLWLFSRGRHGPQRGWSMPMKSPVSAALYS